MSTDVILVCGFGRCGSSLMMQMLDAGGIATTGRHPSFEDNHARLGQVDLEWLGQQHGRAVKVLDPHKCPRMDQVPHIAIWLDRDPTEQTKSHAKFRRERMHAMLCASADLDRLFRTTFEQLVSNPAAVLTVLVPWLASFGFILDAERAKAVVRTRTTKCLPHLLEAELLA